MRIALLGASGHVGRSVVRALLAYPTDVVQQLVLLNRRVIEPGVFPDGDSRLLQYVVDMSRADALGEACAPLLRHVDTLVSTMGVGSGKGPASLFRSVEVDLPSAVARVARASGVQRALLLTGVGANIHATSSWLAGGAAEGKFFHYKGLVEQNFTDVRFPRGLVIFRPSGLLGTSHVPAFMDWLFPMLDWMAPARFRGIHIHRLGAAIARQAVASHGAPETDAAPLDVGNRVTILEGKSLFTVLDDRRWRANLA